MEFESRGCKVELPHSYVRIKQNLILLELTEKQIVYTYANEPDLLNIDLFDQIAKQWIDVNLFKKGT